MASHREPKAQPKPKAPTQLLGKAVSGSTVTIGGIGYRVIGESAVYPGQVKVRRLDDASAVYLPPQTPLDAAE